MGVPESFIRLLSNLLMRGGVYHEHAEKHDMTSDTTSLAVMNLYCSLWSDLIPLDVEEAVLLSVSYHSLNSIHILDIMRRHMHDGPE